MRGLAGPFGTAAFAAGAALAGEALAVVPAQAVCGVFDRYPCAPTVCSVFLRRPCLPEFEPPIGEDLRLTIRTDPSGERAEGASRDIRSDRQVGTISQLFALLRGCWTPAPLGDVPHDMQMSVRLSFKRDGELVAPARMTYVSAGAPQQARERFHDAIVAALDRCLPLPFINGLGGAVAGRPITIRFIENGTLPMEKP